METGKPTRSSGTTTHTYSVEIAPIRPEEEVIGIIANDQPRAYRLRAFNQYSRHIVNDVVENLPISVTYCDRTDLIRVFTCDKLGEPIELSIGGFMEGQLSARFRGVDFKQNADDAPLPDFEFVRTTWKEWVAEHPDTDAYVGLVEGFEGNDEKSAD